MSSRPGLFPSLIIVLVVFGAMGGFLFLFYRYDAPKIAVVVMAPGFGDLSMADQAREGLYEIEGDMSILIYIPDEMPTNDIEARTLLTDLAATGSYELIVAIGADMKLVVQEVATNYPNQKFAMIGDTINAENIASATFAIEQAAFVAGALAAMIANDDPYGGKIAILGSVQNDPTVMDLVSGFKQGVNDAMLRYNFTVDIISEEYLGGFNESEAAKNAIIELFIDDFASIVFAPVRAAIVGVREGMLIANQSISAWDRMPLVIAAEGDQDYYGNPDPLIPAGPSWITTSVVQRTDIAIYQIINSTLWEEFPHGQNFHYTLEPTIFWQNQFIGGVNITDFEFSAVYVDELYISRTLHYKEWIINGTIVVTP